MRKLRLRVVKSTHKVTQLVSSRARILMWVSDPLNRGICLPFNKLYPGRFRAAIYGVALNTFFCPELSETVLVC